MLRTPPYWCQLRGKLSHRINMDNSISWGVTLLADAQANSKMMPTLSLLAAPEVFDMNLVARSGITGCHNNLRCLQWRQSWHRDNSLLSVFMFMFIDLPDPIRHRRYGKHQKTYGHMKAPHFRERSESSCKVRLHNYNVSPAHFLYIYVPGQVTKQPMSFAHSLDE